MSEVVIAFRRPPSMTSSEMRAWVIDRARVGQRALVVSVPDASWNQQGLRLSVEIDDEERAAADDELADLMLDMRLLGLCPAIVRTEPSATQDR